MFVSYFCNGQTKFSLRSDGIILKEDKPFFPRGFYIDRGTIDYYKTQVRKISNENNFNIINVPYVGGSDAEWISFLDYCYSRNIYVISQLYYEDDFLGPVKAFKKHPAVCGWSVADDADNGYFSIDQLKTRHSKLKAEDPMHITDMSLTGYYLKRREEANNFTSISDVPSYQIYPISPLPDYDVTPTNALTELYKRILLYVQSASLYKKSLIVNNQLFNWAKISTVTNPRYPTAMESRNMVFAAIAAGAKGFISYVLSDELTAEKDLWNETVAINKDLDSIQSILIDGTRSVINTNDSELIATSWEYQNKYYILVVNTSYTKEKSLTISVPTKYNGQMKKLFARYPSSLTYSNNKLTGTVKGTEVQLYEIVVSGTTASTEITEKESDFSSINIINIFPNPTRGNSYLTYTLKQNSNVKITLSDALGRMNDTIINEKQLLGNHQVLINSANYPSGLYSIVISTYTDSRHINLIIE
jgi:hypothetical protein